MTDLSRLFAPDSIAVIGASADPEKLSGRPHRFLEKHGYPGDVFLVNPNRETIAGTPCYSSIADVPRSVDLALVLAPAGAVTSIVRECGAASVPYAVVIASGFAESGNHDRQVELRTTAKAAGVRLLGPNSEGFLDLPNRVAASFSSILHRDDLEPGSLAFVTQSGAFGGALFQLTQDMGIGTSLWVSTGNEVDIDTLDIVEYLIEDDATNLIGCYIESLSRGQRLLELGRRAAANGTRIVALRVGASNLGREAAASHTGSVSTTDDVYDAIFRQAGVLRVRSVDDFLDTVSSLARTPDTALPAEGEELGVVSISGGAAVLIADTCDRLDVPLATLSDQTRAAVEADIPAYGSATNPLDVTAAAISDPGVFEGCIDAIANDPAVGPLLVQFGNSGRNMIESFTDTLLDRRSETGRPILCVFTGSEPRERTRTELEAGGVLVFEDPVRAVAVVQKFFDRAHACRRLEHSPTQREPTPRPTPTDWPSLQASLEECGVPFTPTTPVEDATAAVEAAERFGYPVVLKLDPLTVAHKTELDGVRTDLSSPAAVREAYDAIADGDPLVCQPHVTGIEALAGVRRDDDFGPVVTLGPGGVFVELFDEFAHRALPVNDRDIRAAITETPLHRLLEGYRGTTGDIAALTELVVGLARFYTRFDCRTIECNPVVVTATGARAVDIYLE